MKLFIASDIHGSAYWCAKMLEAFETSGAERLVLLGDILYHGPRNDLPDEYSPKKVIELLSAYSDKILCVRGNCDAEVDQMVLPFPIMAEYSVIFDGDTRIYCAHGHKAGPDTPPSLADGDVLICGHTHVPVNKKIGNFTHVNPGSTSLPKESSPHSAVVYENGEFHHVSLENGEEYTV